MTRVSTNWRSISTADSTLWTEVDYRAATQKVVCGCQFCKTDERGASCIGCGQRARCELDNIGLVKMVLDRSGAMPLRVDLTLAGNAMFKCITPVLQPASNRIVYLHLSADDNSRVAAFLKELGSLETLQQLVIVNRAETIDEGGLELPSMLFKHMTDPLPALRHLEVQGSYRLFSELKLPALEYARLPIHDTSDFGRGLKLCDKIRYLHYQVGESVFDDALDSERCIELHNRLIRLAPDVVVISNIYVLDIAAVMRVVHIPELPNLTLAFRRDSVVRLGVFAIFADIKGSWSLAWILQRTTSELCATESNGVVRKVTWEDGELEDEIDSLWSQLPPLDNLHQIELDDANWLFSIPDMPQARELSVNFDCATGLSQAFYLFARRLPRWPRLERLRLQFIGGKSTDLRRGFAEKVIRIVKCSTVPKLKYLEVSGLDLVDVVFSLSEVAEFVVPIY